MNIPGWLGPILAAVPSAKIAELLRERVALITAERDAALRRVSELETEVKALREKIALLETENKNLQVQRDELTQQLAALRKGGAVQSVRVRRGSDRFSGL